MLNISMLRIIAALSLLIVSIGPASATPVTYKAGPPDGSIIVNDGASGWLLHCCKFEPVPSAQVTLTLAANEKKLVVARFSSTFLCTTSNASDIGMACNLLIGSKKNNGPITYWNPYGGNGNIIANVVQGLQQSTLSLVRENVLVGPGTFVIKPVASIDGSSDAGLWFWDWTLEVTTASLK
jgi:hypothetical protein